MSSFVPDPSYTTLISNDGQHIADPNSIGWKGQSITSVTLSGVTYQVYVFWDKDEKLSLATRTIGGAWTIYTTAITFGGGGDGHNAIGVGLDPNGYIHVVYDCHNTALKYRKSVNPINTFDGTLTTTLSMLGTNETSVTYPAFINDPAGNLYIFFRSGAGSADSDAYFYKYDHGTTTWAGVAGTTAGKLLDGHTDAKGVYYWQPAFDADFGSGGKCHIFFTYLHATGYYWKIAYVAWDGTDFHKSDGSAQTVPIRHADADIVDQYSPPFTNLQPSTLTMAVYSDSDDHPHLAYSKDDALSGNCHLFHAWYNGSAWVIRKLTNYDNDNPDKIYPILAINRTNDQVFIIYIDLADPVGTNGELLLLKSAPGDYTSWIKYVVYPNPTQLNASGGRYHPKFDTQRWEKTFTFSIPIEYWEWDVGMTSLPIRLFEPTFGKAKTYVYGVRTEREP